MKIEGKAAWDYIEEDKLPVTGWYTDPQQRLNSIFASYQADQGIWSRIGGQFTSTRDWSKNNITLSVRTIAGKMEDVVIPWVVKYASNSTWSYRSGEAL